MLSSPEAARKTLREVCILRRLTGHPCVIRLLDAFVRPSTAGPKALSPEGVLTPLSVDLYIALEPATDGDLFSLRGHVSAATARSLVGHIASALEYLHANRVWHRDLKSSNVLLFRDAEGKLVAKLADFGSARSAVSGGCGGAGGGGASFFASAKDGKGGGSESKQQQRRSHCCPCLLQQEERRRRRGLGGAADAPRRHAALPRAGGLPGARGAVQLGDRHVEPRVSLREREREKERVVSDFFGVFFGVFFLKFFFLLFSFAFFRRQEPRRAPASSSPALAFCSHILPYKKTKTKTKKTAA